MGLFEGWQTVFAIGALVINSVVTEVSSLQFTREPGNRVAVATHPTWWHCSAHSDDPVTYTWSRGSQPVNGRPNYAVLSNGTLHIASVGQSDVGSYTCQARTSRGEIVTSREAYLTLATLGSAFSASPQSQSLNLGGPATLRCTVASNPQADVAWLFDGGAVADGAAVAVTTVGAATTRSTLSIASLGHRHGGRYRCLATNRLLPDAAVYSGSATLMLIGRPGFSVTPSPQTVAAGGAVTFRCETTGSPPASVQWLDPEGDVIQSLGRFAPASATLHIASLQAADAGFYTCRASNEWGSNSASALLTVGAAVQQVVFTATPSDQTAAVGSRVTLPCSAVGSPDPVITWSKQGGMLPADRVEEPAPGWLRITSVIATDSGVYICTASNGLSSISSQARLIVQVPPSFTASPVDATARAGQSAFFRCRAEGSPTPAVAWTAPTAGGAPLQAPSGPHGAVEVSADGTLTIGPVERRHAGTYVCTATNSVAAVSRSATLRVQSPPFFTTLPADQRVVEGSSVQLACRAEADPPPRLTWLFNGALVVSDPKHAVFGNGDLALRNAEKDQEGAYTCRAENDLGAVETSAFVVVLVPPDFAVYPADLTVQLGDSVVLDCVGTGDPSPVLRWLKDEQPLVLESNVAILANFSLSLSDIVERNLGTYTCVISNEAGTNQIAAQVWTPDVPFFTVPPTNTTANESTPATIPCQASARSGPMIRWYLVDDRGNRGGEAGLGTGPAGHRGAGSFVGPDGGLVFSDVSRADQGAYECEASNGVGSVARTVSLLVNVPPEITSVTSPVAASETDAHAILQCVAAGRPRPRLSWYLPTGAPVPDDDPSAYNAQPASGYLVVYSPSVRTHDGDFSCLAENFLGNDSAVVTVIVRGAPFLTNLLATATGSAVTLRCLTRGSPAPTRTWSRDGLDIVAGLTGHSVAADGGLVIRDPELAQSGTYRCTVANSFGLVSATFRVPDAPGTPQVTLITPTSIDLGWSPPAPSSNLTRAGYRLQYIRFADAVYRDVAGAIDGPAASATGLAPYTGYAFRVRAVNELGGGPFSLVTPFVLTAESVPSEPRDLQVTPSGDSLIVTWTEPESLNSNPANVVYQVGSRLRDGRPDQETVLSRDHRDLPHRVVVADVRRDAGYRVRVRAGNTLLGVWSDYASADAQTLIEAPSESVAGLTAVALGFSAVKLQWEPVADAAFDHYSVAFRRLDSNASDETLRVTDVRADNLTVTGLTADTDYAVKMAYSNAGGQGPYSDEVRVKTELEPPTPGGDNRGGTSGGVLAAVVCSAVAVVLLLLILVAVLCRRRGHDAAGWIGRKRLNPDALWIHKSSGNSGQKGTYDVAVVNENYLAEDTVMSTDSAYDLGSGDGQPAAETQEKAAKKKKKRSKKWSDVIYKSPRNPGVVLVKKAVIGDSDFSPPPVALANQTLDEVRPDDETESREDESAKPAAGEGADDKGSADPTLRAPAIPTVSAEFPIATDLPPPDDDDPFPVHSAEFLASHASATAAAQFPVFPNAGGGGDGGGSADIAAELNVDGKQMRKMARWAAREQRRKEKKERKAQEKAGAGTTEGQGPGSGRSRRRKLSDRIANLRKQGSLSFNQDGGDGGGVVERDYPMMTERQKENAVMF